WSRRQYEGLFAATDPQSPERFILVVEDASEPRPEMESSPAGQLTAFLVARRVDKEWELENIVVAEEFRQRGVGSRLLGKFIAHVRAENGSGIFLEVRESNRCARALYRRAGFDQTGLRKGYYANPAEDAILYRLSLLLESSHNETAPEFGIEQVLGLW
ncbi:MAG: ribosomal protein S18-alanine N-acetyltransferase, partial [Candidatus Sulfotelmatobacter sp.]